MPFKAYVPSNYDASKPAGIFVYMGYKDTTATPPLWREFLDKSNLIFISAVSHTGEHYPNSIPIWQSIGLTLDAVDNLKRMYKIDEHRVYLMGFTDHVQQIELLTDDVFTGFIDAFDVTWFGRLALPDGRFVAPSFPQPSITVQRLAKTRPFFLIDDGSDLGKSENLAKAAAMTKAGYLFVKTATLSSDPDLHYPNFKLEWFQEQALPFLDESVAQAAKNAPPVRAPIHVATEPASPPSAAPSEAQHLMSMAKLFMDNGHTELAKPKLQQLVDQYPSDPLAAEAKEMLDQIGGGGQ
jgi:hypothetical protein